MMRSRNVWVAMTLTLAIAAGTVDTIAQQPALGRLASAPNFRDIGGYATADGRKVRMGKIYRTSDLSRLTADDGKILETLGIMAVCDFRRDDERAAAPDLWPGANRPMIMAMPPIGTDSGPGVMDLMEKGASPDQLRAVMRDSYRAYVDNLTPQYRTVLQMIRQTGGAVMYHCTAGKDRTGTFTALLLTMLGVPKATVFQDYLISNQTVANDKIVAGASARFMVPADAARVVLGVDQEYLQIIFDVIDQKFGSFDNYRRTALGVSDADLAELKSRLLE